MDFRWNEFNLEHATRHGISIRECQRVVSNARRPWPMRGRGDSWIVQGRGQGDRMVQVVYVVDPDGTIYVISAMPLTTRRRRGRRK